MMPYEFSEAMPSIDVQNRILAFERTEPAFIYICTDMGLHFSYFGMGVLAGLEVFETGNHLDGAPFAYRQGYGMGCAIALKEQRARDAQRMAVPQ